VQNGNDNPESDPGAEVEDIALPSPPRQENPHSIPHDAVARPASVEQWLDGETGLPGFTGSTTHFCRGSAAFRLSLDR